MKHSSRCPRCDGQVLFRVQRMQIPDHRYSNSDTFRPVTLTGRETTDAVGIEAWVCDGCSYTELYANGMGLLRAMAGEPGSGVTKIS